jgi:hypothetical protein
MDQGLQLLAATSLILVVTKKGLGMTHLGGST